MSTQHLRDATRLAKEWWTVSDQPVAGTGGSRHILGARP